MGCGGAFEVAFNHHISWLNPQNINDDFYNPMALIEILDNFLTANLGF